MKKLRLEDIEVDSYETHTVPQDRGTVQANAITTLCNTFRCPTNDFGSCASAPYCC